MTRKSLLLGPLLSAFALVSTQTLSVQAAGPDLVSTAFHVRVPTGMSPKATLWVAYGPVAGKFGIIRLHSTSSGQFVASARFPRGTHATFYYIQGQGTVQTRAGLAPGNPTQTLGRVGPLVIGRQPVPMFRVTPATG